MKVFNYFLVWPLSKRVEYFGSFETQKFAKELFESYCLNNDVEKDIILVKSVCKGFYTFH